MTPSTKHFPATEGNLGWVLGWGMRLAEGLDLRTIGGAILCTGCYALNLLYLYVVAAILLRQPPKKSGRPTEDAEYGVNS